MHKIETKCIHGEESDCLTKSYGAVAVPIYQTAMFSHPGIGQNQGYDYSRESNPTRSYLEDIIKTLEGAVDTVACSSGMSAISICLSLFDPGNHIICGDDLYGGSVRMFNFYNHFGLEFSYLNTADTNAIEKAIKPQTRAIYIETPSNPLMKISDLRKIGQIAKQNNLLLIVDNTFLSPYLQTPLELGADIVIHSGTKFLSGHNDVIAGVISTSSDKLAKKIREIYKTKGCCLSPFDSYLLIRGIKTLAIRQDRQQENATKIADWLSRQKKITQVYYPGLKTHPGYEINKSQARGAGSMISFRVDSSSTARRILENVKVITYAESLGGVETLITYPMIQTHSDVPEEIRQELGITDDFLRLSVGIENIDDLLADLSQAIGE